MGWIALHPEASVRDPHLTLAWWPKHWKPGWDERATNVAASLPYIARQPVVVEAQGRVAVGHNGSKPAVRVETTAMLLALRQAVRNIAKSGNGWLPHVTVCWEGGVLKDPKTFTFTHVGLHVHNLSTYWRFGDGADACTAVVG